MNALVSQIQSIATLYAEILICIAAASLLGWFIGLMMQRSRQKRRLRDTNAEWATRFSILEKTARDDEGNLLLQLQSLGNESKLLQEKNRTLAESLKRNDTNSQRIRAEAIELNRQHTESHERLQRIIQQKDREIIELGSRLNLNPGTRHFASATHIASSKVRSTRFAELSDMDLSHADTVAISPAYISAEIMDATVQLSMQAAPVAPKINHTRTLVTDLDNSLDDTSDLSGVGLEESTIAMDDEALAFAQRSYKGRKGD